MIKDQIAELNLSTDLAAKLNELSALKRGWDEGEALPISSEAVTAARNALRGLSTLTHFQEPSIVPTFDGFIQLEWHNTARSLEFEYTPDGWSILGVDSVNTDNPLYYTASTPLSDLAQLEQFYIWFSTGELQWPSR